ncbi:hypothetical protein, partial [Actinomadura darangshiensis]|uniref:hypothetical protein n=1 Tax=Actinomadura darangshiensis TaxID=705336 RepID=UPI001AA00257
PDPAPLQTGTLQTGALQTVPSEAGGLAGLRGALERDRSARLAEIGRWIAAAPAGPAELHEEDRYLDLRLSTVTAPHLAGQIVTGGGRTVYASLFAR